MSKQGNKRGNLSNELIFLLLLAEIFALAELVINPFAYVLFRFPESQNLISEMGLLLHGLGSTTSWLNLACFCLMAGLIFFLTLFLWVFLSKAKTAPKEQLLNFFPFAGLLCLSFLIFFYNGFSSSVGRERKLVFYFCLSGGYFFWLIVSLWFWKKAGVWFLFLFSLAVFASVNLVRAFLILYQPELNPMQILLVLFLSGLLILSGAGLGFFLDQTRSLWFFWLKRVSVIILFGLGLFILCAPVLAWRDYYLPRLSKGAQAKPNLIMIVLDTVRQDHLSLYGYERKTTPFLDQLAQASMVFENAYSNSPWTLPAHASFFTGLLPSEHNCTYENLRLKEEFTTLAELLKQRGYFTIGWSNNPLLNRSSGLTQGFKIFVENNQLPLYTGEIVRRIWLKRFPKYSSDNGAQLTNQKLFHWLKRLTPPKKPFFIFLNYMEAHLPYPKNPLAYKFFKVPKQAMSYPSPNWDLYNCRAENKRQLRNIAIKWYDGAIFYLDHQLSLVFKQLTKLGLLENTIIIILSDHGESFGEHHWWGHGVNLYDSELKVPLLIYYPKKLPPGKISQNFSLKELPELIISLIDNCPGRDCSELMEQMEKPAPIFAEVFKPIVYIERMKKACPISDLSWLDRRQKTIILRDYKLIWDSRAGWEFYQTSTDPEETNNLFNQNPEALIELQAQLQAFLAQHPISSKAVRMNSRTLNALKSLGYLK